MLNTLVLELLGLWSILNSEMECQKWVLINKILLFILEIWFKYFIKNDSSVYGSYDPFLWIISKFII